MAALACWGENDILRCFRVVYLVGDRERADVLALQLIDKIVVAHVAWHLDDTNVFSVIALDKHLVGGQLKAQVRHKWCDI
jgi:hypothetical protein